MYKRNLSTNFVGLILLFALSLGLLAQIGFMQPVEARTNATILEATAEPTPETKSEVKPSEELATQPNLFFVVLTALIAGAAGYFWGHQSKGDVVPKPAIPPAPLVTTYEKVASDKPIDNISPSVVLPAKSKSVSLPTLNTKEKEQIEFLYELYRECQGIEGRIRVPIDQMIELLKTKNAPYSATQLREIIFRFNNYYPQYVKVETARGIGDTVKIEWQPEGLNEQGSERWRKNQSTNTSY